MLGSICDEVSEIRYPTCKIKDTIIDIAQCQIIFTSTQFYQKAWRFYTIANVSTLWMVFLGIRWHAIQQRKGVHDQYQYYANYS